MTPDLWRQVEETYQALADLPPDQQLTALTQVRDAVVREEVRSLLGAGPMPDGLEHVIQSVAIEAGFAKLRFGPWRARKMIGRGAAGRVYEAIREDSHFEQRAALKVLDTDVDQSNRERFWRERKILASLHHPYIAHLIDGGETQSGASYMVLELIDGLPITEWCVVHNPTREQTLQLFLKVCRGVEFAHEHQIIHRDLKPANILVTPDGTPKLLDFGIAKPLTKTLNMTRTGFQPFTPAYASPEQLRGLAVTAVTDVYSLGVVLYEMLTRRTPAPLPTTTTRDLRRVFQQVRPGQTRLARDLDDILLTALRQDPEQRYPSVQALAGDIERFLARRVIAARQTSPWHRTVRFVQRNAWPVFALITVVISVIVGITVSQHHARRAQRHLQAMRNLANDVLAVTDKQFNEVPAAADGRRKLIETVLSHLERLAADTGGDRELETELAIAYQRVGSSLSTLPSGEPRDSLQRAIELGEHVRSSGGADPRLMEALARSYYLLGLRWYELGKLDLARQNLSTAVERGRDARIEKRGALVCTSACRWLGRLEIESGQVSKAVYWTQEAVRSGEEAVRMERSPATVQELTSARSYLSRALRLSGDLNRATQVAHSAAAEGERIHTANPDSSEATLALVSGYLGPAAGHIMPSDMYARVLSRDTVVAGVSYARQMTVREPAINYWWTWFLMGLLQESAVEPDTHQATATAREALAIAEKRVEAARATTLTVRNRAYARIQLATCLHRSGDRVGAAEQAALANRELAEGFNDRESRAAILQATLVLASIYEASGDRARAAERFESARSIAAPLAAADPSDMRIAAYLAHTYEGLGRSTYDRTVAAEWFSKSAATWRSWPGHGTSTDYSREHLQQAQRWLAGGRQ